MEKQCTIGWVNDCAGSSHVDGVIFVKSSPIVSITRLPHTHNPREIPQPPYNRMYRGVSDFCCTEPSVYINQRAINGPMALLQQFDSCQNSNSNFAPQSKRSNDFNSYARVKYDGLKYSVFR